MRVTLIAVWKLLIVVASLAAEHQLEGVPASVAVAHRLKLLQDKWDLLGPGLNSCLLHWQADSLPLSHQGSP